MIIELEKQISEEEAEKLLTANCGKTLSNDVFDEFGNYNYPFEQKLKVPNTAIGFIGKTD